MVVSYTTFTSIHPIGQNLVTWPYHNWLQGRSANIIFILGGLSSDKIYITKKDETRYCRKLGVSDLQCAPPILWISAFT